MENDFNNGKSGFNDESFIPDKQSQKGGKRTIGILLLIAGLLLFAVISGIFYDWGINRGGFEDIANLFSSDKKIEKQEKVISEQKEMIEDKDLPEYDEYMDTAGSYKDEDEIVYQEEQNIQPEKNEKPRQVAVKPEIKKSKEEKNKPEEQTQDTKTSWNNPPYPDNLTSRIKKSNVKEGEQLFTIQVYATPSLDDAEEWKEKLERQNIPDVVITTQKIRDRNWYRIRFGSFKSIDEAKSAAQKSGFANSWIDRIR
jgi:cell division septation protein DedD